MLPAVLLIDARTALNQPVCPPNLPLPPWLLWLQIDLVFSIYLQLNCHWQAAGALQLAARPD